MESLWKWPSAVNRPCWSSWWWGRTSWAASRERVSKHGARARVVEMWRRGQRRLGAGIGNKRLSIMVLIVMGRTWRRSKLTNMKKRDATLRRFMSPSNNFCLLRRENEHRSSQTLCIEHFWTKVWVPCIVRQRFELVLGLSSSIACWSRKSYRYGLRTTLKCSNSTNWINWSRSECKRTEVRPSRR